MTDENGADGRIAVLARRAGSSPSVIGAAVGAAAAAALAKRGAHAPAHDDEEPPTPKDPEEDRSDGDDSNETDDTSDPDDSNEAHEREDGDDASASGSPSPDHIRARMLEELLEQFADGSAYFDVAQMNRLERLIRTREELERYAVVLAKRVRDEPATDHIFNRLERMLSLLSH